MSIVLDEEIDKGTEGGGEKVGSEFEKVNYGSASRVAQRFLGGLLVAGIVTYCEF